MKENNILKQSADIMSATKSDNDQNVAHKGIATGRKASPYTDFLLAGTAAVAAICCTNPMDVVKTRLQLQGELQGNAMARGGGGGVKVYRGVFHALTSIGRAEGLRGLQRGLAPACLLQFSNVGTRFGAYAVAKHITGITPESGASYAASVGLAGISGALAAIVSNPFFLLKTRFQAQSSVADIAVGFQRSDRTLRDAILRIYREDGMRGYYRGIDSFIPRVIAASSVQLSTYDLVKHQLMNRFSLKDNISTHFASSLITGMAVVLAMQPFDIAATRMMNQKSENGRGSVYSSSFDVVRKTLATEGIRGMYKGTLASYLRFGPYCILVFVFLEQLRSLHAELLLTA